MILMPDIVIDRVNLLGKYQQDLMVFTYCKGWIIWYGDVNLTVVDGDGVKNEAPLKLKIRMILAIKMINRMSILSRRTKPLFDNPSK